MRTLKCNHEARHNLLGGRDVFDAHLFNPTIIGMSTNGVLAFSQLGEYHPFSGQFHYQ
jgi:hypothetical protein